MPGNGRRNVALIENGINYSTCPERRASGPLPLAALEPTVPVEMPGTAAGLQVAEFGNGRKQSYSGFSKA